MAIDLTPIIDAVESALTTEFAGTTLTFGIQSPTPANGAESVWCAVEFASYNYASTGIIYGLLTVNCFSHVGLTEATDLGDRAKTVLDALTLAGVTAQPATTPRQVTRSGSLYQSRSTVSFTVQGLTISSFSPTQGSPTDEFTGYGAGFIGATSALINGVAITDFVVVSDTVFTGTVPTTTTGKVTVTNSGETATSLSDFKVTTGSVSWNEIGGAIGTNPSLEYQLLKQFWVYS